MAHVRSPVIYPGGNVFLTEQGIHPSGGCQKIILPGALSHTENDLSRPIQLHMGMVRGHIGQKMKGRIGIDQPLSCCPAQLPCPGQKLFDDILIPLFMQLYAAAGIPRFIRPGFFVDAVRADQHEPAAFRKRAENLHHTEVFKIIESPVLRGKNQAQPS